MTSGLHIGAPPSVAATGVPTVFNVKDAVYGAKGDGSTDDTVAIRAAITACAAAGGGTVYLPPGTYQIATTGGLTLTSGVRLKGAGVGATILNQAAWGSWGPSSHGCVIQAVGSLASAVSLTSNAALGDQTIAAVTTGISVGDVLLVGSNTVFATDAPGTNRYTGEFARVSMINSGSLLTIYGYLRDAYPTSDSASFQKMTFCTGVGVSDLTINNTAPGAGGGTHTSGMIDIWACRDFAISDVKLIGSDIGGLNVTLSYNGTVSRLTCQDFTDNSGAGQFGYGMFVSRATELLKIDDCHFANTRHGISFGGEDGLRGIDRNCLVTNCTSTEAHLQAFDTHAECEDITFENCHARNTANPGFLTRGRACKFIGCTVEHCAAGISIYPDAHGTVVTGCTLRHIRYITNFGHGIMVGGSDHVVLEGNTIEQTACAALYIYKAADNTSATNGRFRNNIVSNSGISNISNNKSAITTGGGVAMTGWVIEGNTFYKTTSLVGTTPEKESDTVSAGMDLAFNAASTATGNYFINNVTIGFAAGGNLYFDSAGTNINTVTGNVEIDRAPVIWTPSGVIAENIPGGRFAPLSNVAALVSGRLQLAGGIILKGGRKYNSITFVSSGTAAISPTNAWACFVDSNGSSILVKSTDKTTTAWGSNTAVTYSFASGYFTYVDRAVWCGLMVAAGTVPSMLGLTIDAGAGAFAPLPAATGASATGLTTPASLTAIGTLSFSPSLLYCYVS